ncbi:hypothetical protein ACFQ4A_10705 [Lentibacillus salinarum]|uniref:Transposase n=1 Tax=Lentibacillus salinarum TaxID=446820 RepID=A0ABW3ZV56_9BACI
MKYYTLEDMSIKEMAFQGCVSENAVMLWGREAKKELRKQYIFLYE